MEGAFVVHFAVKKMTQRHNVKTILHLPLMQGVKMFKRCCLPYLFLTS